MFFHRKKHICCIIVHHIYLHLSMIWSSLVAQLVKNLPAKQETWVRSLGCEIPGEGKGYPIQCSGLENSMGCVIHGVAKSQTRLSDFHFSMIYFSVGGTQVVSGYLQ